MSLVFAPFVRLNAGRVPLSVGVGAVAGQTTAQGLKISDVGFIYAVMDGTIDHYANGLPFDVNGRLVVSQSPPSRISMSVPFTSTGAVSGGE